MEVSIVAIGSGGSGRSRDEGGILEGSWLWVALPVGVLGLIAALWFLVIAPAGGAPPKATVTPAKTATSQAAPSVTLASIEKPTNTAQPTDVPLPTAAPTAMPTAIGLGVRVEVTGTGAQQLSVRSAAGTSATRLKFVPDGTKFVVVGGPEDANGYTWWKVDDQAGTVGWVAGKFLKLTP
ncbi:MAG TPA: SH3 domain-containing protein [Anaerolineae bacterium]|nr:SH3 domain-containing protein [Anaerolineae bacterium]